MVFNHEGANMPNYDYRCPACGREFEVFHKIAEQGSRRCPAKCGTKKKPHKMITFAAGFSQPLFADAPTGESRSWPLNLPMSLVWRKSIIRPAGAF